MRMPRPGTKFNRIWAGGDGSGDDGSCVGARFSHLGKYFHIYRHSFCLNASKYCPLPAGNLIMGYFRRETWRSDRVHLDGQDFVLCFWSRNRWPPCLIDLIVVPIWNFQKSASWQPVLQIWSLKRWRQCLRSCASHLPPWHWVHQNNVLMPFITRAGPENCEKYLDRACWGLRRYMVLPFCPAFTSL